MLSPQAETIIAEMRARPADVLLPVEDERAAVDAAAKAQKLPEGTLVAGVSLNGVLCEQVERGDGGDGQVILYVHGGGFCVGSSRSHRLFAARLAQASGCKVLVPDYALAPEEPFPAGIDDVVAVYAALAEAGVQPGDITLAGDSAGGAVALAAVVKLRELSAPMPRAIVLLSPWLDLSLSGASHTANRKYPNMAEPRLRRAAAWYAPEAQHRDGQVSPLFADLRGLPPMLVQAGDREIFVDDAVEVVRRARAAGVEATLSVAAELWHVYQHSDCPEARDAIEQMSAFVHAAVPAEAA